MKTIATLVAAAVLVTGVPASAAVTVNDYTLSFAGGSELVFPTPATAPGEYQDNFTFTLVDPAAFAGALVSQQLTSPLGAVLSNLDFGNSLGGIFLDGTAYGIGAGSMGLDLELLPASLLLAGSHTLTVNYTVTAASSTSVAAYLGLFALSSLPTVPAVPEPGTWGLLLLGFGTLGAAMRRRSTVTRVSFS